MAGWRRMGGLGLCLLGVWVGRTVMAAETPMMNPKPGGVAMTVVPPDGAAEQATPIEASRVSMDFQDANVKDVLKVFSKETGLNVIGKEDIGNRTITLYLEDVSVIDALDQILRAADLTYERPAGSDIFIVRAKPSAGEVGTETRVYRLKFARVSTSRLARAMEALGSVTPFEAQQLTQALGVTSSSGSSSGSGGRPQLSTGQAKDIGIDRVVKELLTPQGKLMVDERTNSLVVTEISENFPRIEAVLNALDIKTMQVLIEAEVLETTLTKLKDLGVEWGSGTEGSLLTVTPAKRTTRAPFSTIWGKGEKSGGATNITMGTIDASQMNAVLQALEHDSETKVLARPKVLTLENESAVIRLTSPQAVGVTSVTVTQSGDIIQTPERMTTGIVLSVTPEVNDNGYITMLVEPSVTKTVVSEISSKIVDPRTRSARALVRVRNGHTLVLGGLIDRTEQDTVQRVPILSGIPFIGGAFKDVHKNNSASELIVFVTPRIMAEPTGSRVMWQGQGQASTPAREQEGSPSRQQLIDDTMKRLGQ